MPAITRAHVLRGSLTGTAAALLLLVSTACSEPTPPAPDLTAPQVQLTSPTREPFFTQGGVRITGTVTDSVRVERVSVSVDGEPARSLSITPARSVTFTDSLDLPPGPHSITISACDLAANCSESKRTVRVDRVSPRFSLIYANQVTYGETTQLTLRLYAADSSGLRAMRLNVNGAISSDVLGGVAFVDQTHRMLLNEGANSFVLDVEDQAGNAASFRLRTEFSNPAVLALAGFTSCALDSAGRASCWGEGMRGVLGDGSLESRSYARPVSGDQRFVSLAAGANHMCGLTAEGRAFCWGQNYSGAVGDGSTTALVTMPTPVSGGIRFKQLDASTYGTCGVDLSGVAYCWGGPTGASEDRTPRAVTSPVPFESVESGQSFSCGIDTSKQLYCWQPDQRIATPAAVGHRFRQVEIGGHWCGITLQDAIVCPGADRMGNPGPFRSLSIGLDANCGVTPGGEIHCWNYVTPPRTYHPTHVWDSVVQVAHRSGSASTNACGRTTGGRTYCWAHHVASEIHRLMFTGNFEADVVRLESFVPIRAKH